MRKKHTAGFIKPTELFPAVIRASLIRVIIDAMTGAEADVPSTRINLPSTAKK
jgi:hypothetical protein